MEAKLLGALALCRPKTVAVDTLSQALWSEPPRSARKTVQTMVLRLRSRFGRAVVETHGGAYRLGPSVDVDVEQFEQALARIRSLDDPGVAAWDNALAWCEDPSLDDFAEWAPAEPVRARVAEMRSSAIEARWRAALDAGGAARAIPSLEALVTIEPLREQPWALLLRAYGEAGRHSDGLRAFERARRVLASEIGVSPGPELVNAYERLLNAGIAPLDDPLPSTSRAALAARSDRLKAEADLADRRGDRTEAVHLFLAAADAAREADDPRRLGEAALGAAGDSWVTSLDATREEVALVAEALEMVPPGPTPMRCRLLARHAITGGHHLRAAVCAQTALSALAIGRAIGDPAALAEALHAASSVISDPTQRDTRWGWAQELETLGQGSSRGLWTRWALAHEARLLALDGDIDGAGATLDRLDINAAVAYDLGARYQASFAGVLRTTVRGDWAGARAAVDATARASDAATYDPAGSSLARMGALGVLELLEGPVSVPRLPPIEWPLPSLELTAKAWHADMLATAGRPEAAEELEAIAPAAVADVDRDGYWLPTMMMLADAAFRAESPAIAEAVGVALGPVVHLTVVDPGLIYRGAAAHGAGLAAAALGNRSDAIELLRNAREQHLRHGSAWMATRSNCALAALSHG